MANTLTFASRTLTDANIFGGIHFLADLNTGEEFTIGNTASASVSFVTDIQLPLYTKDATNGKFTWTQDSASRGRYFITEVTKEADRYNVTAYDAMYLLETNISALSIGFPLTVSAAASAIANYIGCAVSGTVTNGSLSVSELEEDMTIRSLLGFVAEASGCSVKIDGSDHLCFMYYADSGITITDSQYKEFGLEVADYTCAAIDKVSILNSVGATIATAGSGSNTLYIEGNPFMENASSTHASAVYAKVNGFSYAPLTCEMFGEYGLEVGTIATFGSTPTLVMHLESSEEGAIASSVGSDTRAEYNKSFETMLAEATERALDAADDASKVALNYVTDITSGGVMVHPSGDSTSGWKISDAIELLKSGVSYIWAGLVNNIATIRIGREANGYARTLIDTGGMRVIQRSSSGTDIELANIGYGTGKNSSDTDSIAPYYSLGKRNGTKGNWSVAEGDDTKASGYASHAEGASYGDGSNKTYTTASGNASHAEGYGTRASGVSAHSEGVLSKAIGYASHAEGSNTQAQGYEAHAEGFQTVAQGNYSHAGGNGTVANGEAQTVIGKWNVADAASLFIIGNGTADNARSNALSVAQDGTITVHGAKVPTRNMMCYANSRVDNFVDGQITLSLASLGITTGAKPVGILMTYQDGGATPTILRYDYDASSSSGVVIKAYNSSGGAVSGNVRYFALVFQNSWTSVS